MEWKYQAKFPHPLDETCCLSKNLFESQREKVAFNAAQNPISLANDSLLRLPPLFTRPAEIAVPRPFARICLYFLSQIFTRTACLQLCLSIIFGWDASASSCVLGLWEVLAKFLEKGPSWVSKSVILVSWRASFVSSGSLKEHARH